MALGKQAKSLSRGQVHALLDLVGAYRHATRNKVICLLSVRAGLRAHEIAHLSWDMLSDASGSVGSDIRLEDRASKGRSGRVIPMNRELREALSVWRTEQNAASDYVISTERSSRTTAQAIVNMFFRWYSDLRFVGCSSHSGRRTFITNAARKITSVGGSLRDVQLLAGHSDVRITQRYIESEAQRKVVELISTTWRYCDINVASRNFCQLWPTGRFSSHKYPADSHVLMDGHWTVSASSIPVVSSWGIYGRSLPDLMSNFNRWPHCQSQIRHHARAGSRESKTTPEATYLRLHSDDRSATLFRMVI